MKPLSRRTSSVSAEMSKDGGGVSAVLVGSRNVSCITALTMSRTPGLRPWVRYGPPMADPKPQPVALGPVDFSTHVLSLASSAMIALGEMPAPDGNPHPVDL